MNITTQLAEALRKCEHYANAEFQETADKTAMRVSDEAREILAAYDTQRKSSMTNAHGIHGLHCLQRDDETGRFASDEEARAHVAEALAAYDAQLTQPAPTGDHTAEPWLVESGTLTISAPNFKGPHRARVPVCYPQDTMNREANARRIVACVNACAGIPTERLESMPTEWLARRA